MKEIKRKCQGCNQIFDRKNLIKITKLSDGTLKINPSSKELGKSVYVCKNAECIKNFIKRKRLRTLKINSLETVAKIEEELKAMVFD